MKLRDQYDWIVLGDHPGALLSASLAGKLGLSVLILPLENSQGLWLSADDDVLDPESNLILGIAEGKTAGGLLGNCLKHVGIVPSEQSLFDSDRAIPQVLTPECRIALDRDFERFRSELTREWSKDRLDKTAIAPALQHAEKQIQDFWTEFPSRLTWVTATEGKKKRVIEKNAVTLADLSSYLGKKVPSNTSALRSWFSSSKKATLASWSNSVQSMPVGELFKAIWASVAGSDAPSDAQLFELLHLMALSRWGSSFQGGMVAYREFLLRLARRNGADLPPKTDCRRIFIQNGKFAGVLPTGRGSMIAGNGAILGCPLSRARSLMTTSGRQWFRGFKADTQPVGWKFSLALTLHPEAVSPGVARRMLYQESGAPFLEVEFSHHTEYGLKEQKSTLLFARTLMPMTEQSLNPEYQRMVAARMLRKLTEIHPFLEFHITRIFPDFRTEDDKELTETFGFATLDVIPHNLLCYAGKGSGAQSGVEGLFLASGESFPEYGSFGGTVAALEGVAWLAHRSGLAGPLQA